jgi:hypothetical protein
MTEERKHAILLAIVILTARKLQLFWFSLKWKESALG